MENSNQTMEWQQQMQAYVAWVNSQLKKRPGNKPVTDLGADLQDGTVLSMLIEIVSGEQILDINLTPKTIEEKKSNISNILKFMNARKIQMHRVSDSDIIEGNLKSLMRLILALAAHFKPASVGTKKSVSAVAVNAAAAMGDLRKQVSTSGRYRHRWKSGSPSVSRRLMSQQSSPYTDGDHSSENSATSSPRLHHDLRNKSYMSPSISPLVSPRRHMNSSVSDPQSPITPAARKLYIDDSSLDYSSGEDSVIFNDKLAEEHESLDHDIADTKVLISQLQNLLLDGVVPDEFQAENCEHEESDAVESENLQEQMAIANARLQQTQLENDQLKKQCGKLKEELRNATAGKSALQTRLKQSEIDMLEVKQQLLKIQLECDQLNNEKNQNTAQLEEYKQVKEHLLQKIAARDNKIDEIQRQMQDNSTKYIQKNVHAYNKTIQRKDERIRHLEHALEEMKIELQSKPGKNHYNMHSSEEGNLIRESLKSLRASLPAKDSMQHVLDTLEQAVSSIMQSTHIGKPSPSLSPAYISSSYQFHSPTSNRSRNNNKIIARTPPLSSHHKPHNMHKSHNHFSNDIPTMIIYFTDKTMTPNRITIDKRIGEITLGDFKSQLNLRGKPRFNFKAQDPEYGTVKQEVFNDEDILPGWEGKIVAWVDL